MDGKELLQRYGHGAAALSVSSEWVEVILFGGKSKFLGNDLVNAAVLRFGRSYIYYILNILTLFFHIHVVCNLIFHYSN